MRVWFAVIVLLGVLAACGASSGVTAARAPAGGCAPAGAQTLITDGRAALYAQGANVYGCANSSRRAYLLGASGRTLREGRVGPRTLAGVDVAYGLSRFGVDTGTAQVVVRRLTDGVVLREAPATSRVQGPESYQSVAAIVVKPDGAVAWIGDAHSIVGHGSVVEVHRADRRGQAELDHGSGIVGGSLRLHGSQLTWTHAGRLRSATLS